MIAACRMTRMTFCVAKLHFYSPYCAWLFNPSMYHSIFSTIDFTLIAVHVYVHVYVCVCVCVCVLLAGHFAALSVYIKFMPETEKWSALCCFQ